MSDINASTQQSENISSCNPAQSQLFSELPAETAALVQGGLSDPFSFNSSWTSKTFSARRGATVTLNINSRNFRGILPLPSSVNRDFMARLRNRDTNRTTEKLVRVGEDRIQWTGVRGGRYVIDFFDTRDRIDVRGGFTITT